MEPDRPPHTRLARPPQQRPAVERLTVGLDIEGPLVRYAAVAHDGPAPRLLRLGSASFGPAFAAEVFRAEPAAPREAGAEATDALGRAVLDMLRDLRPTALRLVAHAPHVPGYFVPVADGLPATERYDRIRRETLLLADTRAEPVLRVRSRPVRLGARQSETEADERLVWHRTQLIPGTLHDRMDRLARQVGAIGRGGSRYAILDGAEAATALIRAVEDDTRIGELRYSLAVGLYAEGAELSIAKAGRLYHDRRVEVGARGLDGLMDDVAYFAAALLHAFEVDARDLETVYLYGPRANMVGGEALAELVGAPARWLDASDLFGAQLGTVDPAFVSAIGAALVDR